MKKNCEICGKEFEPRQYNQKYCSAKCAKKASYQKEKENKPKVEDKICTICGQKFTPKISTQTICGSEECKKERNKIRCKNFHEQDKKDKINKICIICGKTFQTNNDFQILCGNKDCHKERASRQKRNIPEEEYKNMVGQFTFKTNNNLKTCPVCDKEFVSKSWNQIYCSESCQEKQICLDRPNNLDKPRICKECGKDFMPNSPGQKYCKECREIVKKRKQKEYNDNKPRKNYEPIPCLYCGELFKPKKSNEKYCCKEHQELHYKKSGYVKTKNHENYIQNIDKYKENHKKYYESHKEETRERGRKNRQKRKEDKDYILKHRITEQIRWHLKNNSQTKDFHTFELLGYTSNDLKNRLESMFEQNSKEGRPKLSWENMGSVWHIDHIKSCASFTFVNQDGSLNKEAIKECWKLENLQPLYAEDNVRKSSYDENGVYWKQGVPISYNPNMDLTT